MTDKNTTLIPEDGWHCLHLYYRIEYGQWQLLSREEQNAAKTNLASLVQEVRATARNIAWHICRRCRRRRNDVIPSEVEESRGENHSIKSRAPSTSLRCAQDDVLSNLTPPCRVRDYGDD